MSYVEKLRDPRWQKRRLKVMEAADWKCQCCGDAASPLEIHHLRYGGEPWSVPDEWLECLCETCHGIRTDAERQCGRVPEWSTKEMFAAMRQIIAEHTLKESLNPPGGVRADPGAEAEKFPEV